MMKYSTLEECYQSLGLPDNASHKDVDDAYFLLRGQMICAGEREDIASLKQARDKLKRHLLSLASQSASALSLLEKLTEPTATEALAAALADQGIIARASLREQTLHLGITVSTAADKRRITAQVYRLLSEASPEDYGLSKVAIVRLYGLKNGQTTLWKQTFPLPNLQPTADDQNLYSFNNRFSNMLVFPGLLLIAALLNAVSAIQFLLFGINIWIHECGHAAVAWLSGYKAIPLPFGWTNISSEKSLFVYFGVLTLLGLLFYTGKKESRVWPMALAGLLAIAQFYLTWITSENTFDLLFSFGGVGGEFYLSTLLIVSFYFPLPAQWRWDFYRYPAVLFAGFTFLGSLWRWQQIKSGVQAIPWGTMLGGSGDAGGDMNRLVDHGWSDQRIIDCYNSLGGLCLITIVSVYAYFFLKQRNHLLIYAFWRRSQVVKLSK